MKADRQPPAATANASTSADKVMAGEDRPQKEPPGIPAAGGSTRPHPTQPAQKPIGRTAIDPTDGAAAPDEIEAWLPESNDGHKALDDDQQNAFDRILAQIEGRGEDGSSLTDAGRSGPASQTPTGVASEVEVVLEPSHSGDAETAPSEETGRQPPQPAVASEPKAKPPLQHDSPPSRRRLLKSLAASGVVVLCLLMAGHLYRSDQTDPPAGAADSVRDPVVNRVPSEPAFQKAAAGPKAVQTPALQTAMDQLDRLRNELLERQRTLEQLHERYQAAIDTEIQHILEQFAPVGSAAPTFEAAMANAPIRWGLDAIQRRQTYMQTLDGPIRNLYRNSEELLFLYRKAELLDLLTSTTRDIDVDGFIRHATDRMESHRSALAKLGPSARVGDPPALERIWRQVLARAAKTDAAAGSGAAAEQDQAAIWQAVCRGDFSRVHQLTALPANTARCLSRWRGKDLFLNALTDLSPEAARQLAAWQGEWLGLNGLSELRDETALHLAQWNGRRLSLNGLRALSPRVVDILSQWPGEQIELVGLNHPVDWGRTQTRLFLAPGYSVSSVPQ